jgi:hypothetical protein
VAGVWRREFTGLIGWGCVRYGMEVDWWTRAIVIYGAVLSTTGVIFQFVRHRQDKPRVTVYVELVEGELHDAVGQGFDPYYKLIATNVGWQPVTVKAVREYQEDDRFELLSNNSDLRGSCKRRKMKLFREQHRHRWR